MRRVISRVAPVLAMVVLAACATPDVAQDVYDPYEEDNRSAHGFNRGLDAVALRPAATGYGTIVPNPIRAGVTNFSSNLGMPSVILNDLLQANFADAGHNSLRFVVNSFLGLGGLFDVAGARGHETRPADFGETLAVWGAGEGAYLEVPFLGPRTERAFAGTVVDAVLNPVNYVLGPQYTVVIYGTRAGSVLESRFVLGDALDEILYESADSYALLRSLYLQNRRFELSQGGAIETDPGADIYEDLYGDIFEE
ncbi:MAG: VacJ family lipoprotein [Pseudomonadota bacterium]